MEECHFIKVDVEGMEENVLRGAQKTIMKFKPILYVENNRWDKSADLIGFVRNLKYIMYWDRRNMLCFPEENLQFHQPEIKLHIEQLEVVK